MGVTAGEGSRGSFKSPWRACASLWLGEDVKPRPAALREDSTRRCAGDKASFGILPIGLSCHEQENAKGRRVEGREVAEILVTRFLLKSGGPIGIQQYATRETSHQVGLTVFNTIY